MPTLFVLETFFSPVYSVTKANVDNTLTLLSFSSPCGIVCVFCHLMMIICRMMSLINTLNFRNRQPHRVLQSIAFIFSHICIVRHIHLILAHARTQENGFRIRRYKFSMHACDPISSLSFVTIRVSMTFPSGSSLISFTLPLGMFLLP